MRTATTSRPSASISSTAAWSENTRPTFARPSAVTVLREALATSLVHSATSGRSSMRVGTPIAVPTAARASPAGPGPPPASRSRSRPVAGSRLGRRTTWSGAIRW